MNKLTKAQRDQTIAIFMGTGLLLAGLWFGIISVQKQKIAQMEEQTRAMQSKITHGSSLISKGPEVKANLELRSRELAAKEATMAPERDTYAWMLNTTKPMILSHRGVSLTISQPEPAAEMNMIPRFYYKGAVFHVRGVGHFHDLGSLLADFENGFPYFRVQGMDLMPSSVLNSDVEGSASPSTISGMVPGAENLDVRFDIVVPVKPADPTTSSK